MDLLIFGKMVSNKYSKSSSSVLLAFIPYNA